MNIEAVSAIGLPSSLLKRIKYEARGQTSKAAIALVSIETGQVG